MTERTSFVATRTNFVNGLPELLILRLLSREEMYGYQLVREIRERSHEALFFGEGCVYQLLHRMVAAGLIRVQRKVVRGRLRHYYQTTARGTKRVARLQREWNLVVAGASAVLGPDPVEGT